MAENHTLGGRRVSALEPSRRGLPVFPFSVMAEIIAQAGALIVPPGLVLESLHESTPTGGFRSVGAGSWKSGASVIWPIRAEFASRSIIFQEGRTGPRSQGRLVCEGKARFTERCPSRSRRLRWPGRSPRQQVHRRAALRRAMALPRPAHAGPDRGRAGQPRWDLGNDRRPSSRIGWCSRAGPWFHTDPIALDTFTHLLGCWGLDCLDKGDVIFPLRMGRLTIHGAAPAAGTPIECRISVREVERHLVRVDAELVRPDGRVWMQIRDWEDWRFYWPARYRDVFRSPDTILIGEELPLAGRCESDAVAVWLEPRATWPVPIWRDVLEQTQLGPEEQAACRRGRSGGWPLPAALGPDRGQGSGAPHLAGSGRSATVPGRPGDRRRTGRPALAPRPGEA